MCHGLTILVTPLIVTSAVPLKPTLLQCIFAPGKALVLLHGDLTQCAIACRVIWIRLVQSASPIE